MNRFLKQALFGTLFVTLLSSCHFFGKRVHGDGHVVSESRNVSGFRDVDVSGAMNVYLSQDATFSVKVETDDNLQEYVEVYKDGETLRIRPRNHTSLDPTGEIKIYVSAPVYEHLEASGASNLISQNELTSNGAFDIDLTGASNATLDLKAPDVSAGMSGASTLTLRGETKTFAVEGSGSSNIRCFSLLSEQTKIDVSGASDAEVFASVKLDVDASGASDIKYKGNASVNQSISGAGSVKKVD